MSIIREPAVAGMFYPGDTQELHRMVSGFLAAVPAVQEPPPKALIVPHAGYIYSGPIAATAYARIQALRGQVSRVVLLGPSHRVGFLGLATSHADYFKTPLGSIPLDHDAARALEALPQVHQLEAAHQLEHSLEVHLPFLQEILDEFTLLPLVVGDAQPEEVAEVLEQVWGGAETLIVISSDLSHYHDYATAKRMDRETSAAFEAMDPDALNFESACGRIPVSGLLVAAKKHGMHLKTIDLRNSGDTAGPRDQVVGYGAYVVN